MTKLLEISDPILLRSMLRTTFVQMFLSECEIYRFARAPGCEVSVIG